VLTTTYLPINHSSGSEKGGYYHELFLRGKGFLSRSIIRADKKETGSKGSRKATASENPAFYEFPFLPESNPKKLPPTTVHTSSTGRESTDHPHHFSLRKNLLRESSVHQEEQQQRIPPNCLVNTLPLAHTSMFQDILRQPNTVASSITPHASWHNTNHYSPAAPQSSSSQLQQSLQGAARHYDPSLGPHMLALLQQAPPTPQVVQLLFEHMHRGRSPGSA
jgi:hypothetical protein